MFTGTLFLIISRIIFILCSYIIHIFAANYLALRQYGYLGILLSLMNLIRVFFANGIPQTISKLTAEKEKERSNILKSGVFLSSTGSLIIFVIYYSLAGLLAAFLKDDSLKNLIRLTAFIIPLMAIYQAYLASLNGQKLFMKQSIVLTLYSVGRIFFAIFFVLIGFQVGGIIAGYICSCFLALLLAKKLNLPTRGIQYFPRKEILKEAVPILFCSIGPILILNIDILLVKNILTDARAAGLYTSASTFARIPYLIFFPFAMTFLPTIAHADTNNIEILKSIIEKGMRQLLILLTPVVLILSSFSEEVISIFYGHEFIAASHSLKLLTFGMGFLVIYASITSIFIVIMPKIPIIISSISVVLQIILCYYFVNIYGIEGAALATSIAALFAMVVGFFMLKFTINCSLKPLTLLRIFIIACVTHYLLSQFSTFGFHKYFVILAAPVFFSLYLILLWLAQEIKATEFNRFFKKFNPFK